MNIDQYISDLLFEYDCVIVPEFGGFISNYAPARIHPTQYLFTAPSKRIGFNLHLKNNDGLLANHIKGCEKITYDNANKIINNFVEHSNGELNSGRKLLIKNVGVLYFDVERHLQFEPDNSINYLLDSFGFSDFQSPAIRRDNYVQGIEKQFKDRVAIPAERRQKSTGLLSEPGRMHLKKYVALTLALPLVATMLWIPLKTDLLKDINYSNLNPFAKKNNAEYTLTLTSSSSIAAGAGTGQANIKEENNQRETTKINLQEAVKTAVIKVPIKKIKGKRFHVVGGCFKIIENAQRLISQLKSRNIEAAIIGQTNSGLYIVSYGDYASRWAARKELARIKASDNDAAWLLKK